MPLKSLAFVKFVDGEPTDLWSVNESGVYVKDNAVGRRYADDAIRMMTHLNNPVLLNQVSREIIGKGRFGGVEIGFCHRIAERLLMT